MGIMKKKKEEEQACLSLLVGLCTVVFDSTSSRYQYRAVPVPEVQYGPSTVQYCTYSMVLVPPAAVVVVEVVQYWYCMSAIILYHYV